MIQIVIDGEPKGKGRPRMSTKTGRAYTPKDTASYENWVKLCYQEQSNGEYFEVEPLRARINCYYSIPKSDSKKKKEEKAEGVLRPTKKPDLDNVAKIILDSLNSIAYKDDSQIVELEINKYYAESARVEILLSGCRDEKI